LQVVRIFRSAGRPKGLTPEVEKKIADIIDEDDTQTYREAAEKLGLPKTALYKYATKDFDYCCLNQTVWPFPSDDSREKRKAISKGIVATPAPYKNEFHQDEKYCVVKAGGPTGRGLRHRARPAARELAHV
jgi:hypothetical protein